MMSWNEMILTNSAKITTLRDTLVLLANWVTIQWNFIFGSIKKIISDHTNLSLFNLYHQSLRWCRCLATEIVVIKFNLVDQLQWIFKYFPKMN